MRAATLVFEKIRHVYVYVQAEDRAFDDGWVCAFARNFGGRNAMLFALRILGFRHISSRNVSLTASSN